MRQLTRKDKGAKGQRGTQEGATAADPANSCPMSNESTGDLSQEFIFASSHSRIIASSQILRHSFPNDPQRLAHLRFHGLDRDAQRGRDLRVFEPLHTTELEYFAAARGKGIHGVSQGDVDLAVA